MNNKNLNQLVCKACTGQTPILDKIEIKNFLNEVNNWKLNDDANMIFKKFKFLNFTKVLSFINLVGKTCEEEKHHPDISFGYGYCLIMIHTHAIKGLSINDFILASKIDLLSY